MKRHIRVRGKISGTPDRPRLNVYRSNANIYAQIIDDVNGVTLVSASTLDKDFEGAAATAKPPRRSAKCSPSVPRQKASNCRV
jgi:large subunit ribosomal protein L18